MSTRVAVASIADFVEGEFRAVRVGQLTLIVGLADGKYFAIRNECPHAGAPLDRGALTGCEITCPRHGAVFDVLTGSNVVPGGLSSVDRFGVEVEAGRLFVTI